MNQLDRFDTLVEIMDRLRGADGCPWDREQSYETLRSYLIEECYEVAEAIDREDYDGLREELGDLLFQIVFLARLAKEQGRFEARDVVRAIAEKMIRRHPHVFGEATAETSAEVLQRWEEIKRQEKRGADAGAAEPNERSLLEGVPRSLPALLKAQRLGTKAARVGFDWERPIDVLDKIDEELAELRRAVAEGRREGIREELGDLLFSAAMLARRLGIDPEGALERTNVKFVRRFTAIEHELARNGERIEDVDLERLEQLWNESKRRCSRRPSPPPESP